MKTIELTVPNRLYSWFLVTWAAIVFGVSVTVAGRVIKQSIPDNAPIVRQANGTLEPEVLGLRRDNEQLKKIIRKLDVDGVYANDIRD